MFFLRISCKWQTISVLFIVAIILINVSAKFVDVMRNNGKANLRKMTAFLVQRITVISGIMIIQLFDFNVNYVPTVFLENPRLVRVFKNLCSLWALAVVKNWTQILFSRIF